MASRASYTKETKLELDPLLGLTSTREHQSSVSVYYAAGGTDCDLSTVSLSELTIIIKPSASEAMHRGIVQMPAIS